MGGLFDGLKLIASSIIGPLAALAMRTEVLSKLFRLAGSVRSDQGGLESA